MKKIQKKIVLTIIDGWGIEKKTKYNAIENARKPVYDKLIREYPNTSLKCDGVHVGLPEGQFGTSEVNHLTIGSGRVIFQDLPRINNDILTGNFYSNDVFIQLIQHCEKNNSNLHLVGILSDGGVHSHINHLFALLDLLHIKSFKQKIFLHVFTDGRDVAPKSAEKYFSSLEKKIKELKNIKITVATVQGRSFLDRDRDWKKTDKCFNLLRKCDGFFVSDWQSLLNLAYNSGVYTDEQIGQYVLDKTGYIQNKDSVLFFHYRTDRIYQILKRFYSENLDTLLIGSFCQPSSEEFPNLLVAFPRMEIKESLSEVISANSMSQIHIAETEKYPHVTYFFNGEKENPFPKEEWILHESNRYIKPYYDIEPSMRNFEISKSIVKSIESNSFDFILANFSSPDMVGHTGNYNAAVVSVQSVDYCLGKIFDSIKNRLDEYVWIITADHGNSEIMWDRKNNQPHTQHTNSKVPFILVTQERNLKLKRNRSIVDIAPTILSLFRIQKSTYMTGESLVISN